MPNRRKVLIGIGGSIALAGCSEVEQFTQPSKEEVKEEAQSPEWEVLFRNISDWEGEAVTYSGVRILDIAVEENSFNMIIQHPDDDGWGSNKFLFCRWDGDPFQDGDTVNLWGIVQGTHTYSSLMGEITVPEIDLVDMELIG